jgi:lysozyme
MTNKRGELVTSEIIEVVLVVAGVFVIVVFLYNLISPTFDRGDKISESFLGILEEQIEIADSGGMGEFYFWGLESAEGENLDYFLVYFGDRNSVNLTLDVSFVSEGNNKNNVCICSFDEGITSCKHCKVLELPALFSQDTEEMFVGEGRKIGIVNEKTHYNFIVEPKSGDDWWDNIPNFFVDPISCEGNEDRDKFDVNEMFPSEEAYSSLRSSEGHRSFIYDDRTGKKVYSWGEVEGYPTIGYGHKIEDNERSEYEKYFDEDMTKEEAENLFKKDVSEHTPKGLVSVELTQNQFDALTNLIFNIGRGGFKNSNIRKYLNEGDCGRAAAAFGQHTTSKGKVLTSLVERRAEEAAWFSGESIPV